jgi:hypothetical protein
MVADAVTPTLLRAPTRQGDWRSCCITRRGADAQPGAFSACPPAAALVIQVGFASGGGWVRLKPAVRHLQKS